MNNKKTLRNLESLMSDILSNRYCQSNLADVFEAVIIQASRRFNDVMTEIGNDVEQSNKDQLCEAIQNPEQWEARRFS